MQKFKKGDKVRIIKYGHLAWTTREGFREQSLFFKRMGLEWDYMLMFGRKPTQSEFDKLKPDEPAILKEKDGMITIDSSPNYVGKEGIIVGSYADLSELNGWGSSRTKENEKEYEIDGIPEKCAWWDEQQLELIKSWDK